MSSITDLTTQTNFDPASTPNGSAAFYNSQGFMKNEVQILGTSISIMQKGMEAGLKQIEDATNGLT